MQLVDDGATGFVNATTNILASDLTVGNIGTNTTLIFTNAGRVKDTNGYIGYSAGLLRWRFAVMRRTRPPAADAANTEKT